MITSLLQEEQESSSEEYDKILNNKRNNLKRIMSNPEPPRTHLNVASAEFRKQTFSEMSNAPSFISNICDSVSLNMSEEISECLEDDCFTSEDLECTSKAPESLRESQSHTSEAIQSSNTRNLTKDLVVGSQITLKNEEECSSERSFRSEKSVAFTSFSSKWNWSTSNLFAR